MISITVNGPYAKVKCNEKTMRRLDDYFAISLPYAKFNPRWRRAIRYGSWDGKVHFFNRLNGRVPSGLVPMIQDQYDGEVFVEDETINKSHKWIRKAVRSIDKLELNGIKLSDFQKEAIRRAIQAKHGIEKMATNSGKTEVACGIIKILGLKTLYMIHRKDLLHQTADRIKLRTGIKCGKIGDGLHKIKDVTVAMVQSLPKTVKANQEFYDQFEVLIMDESHHGSANTWFKIAMFMRAPWKFALSGTPWTGDDVKDLRLISCFGTEILANVENQQLIKSGWSATPTIHVWPFEARGMNTLPWKMAYDRMIADNSQYNELVISIVKQSWEKGLPTLVLVNRMQHGNRLYRRMLGEKIDCRFLSGSSDSQYRKKILEHFRQGKIGVIVATPIFDEGIDVPAIRCLVLAGGGKAPIALLQRVGRALRRKEGENIAEIHDFYHKGNEYLEEHSKERIKIYEQEEFDIKNHKAGETDI